MSQYWLPLIAKRLLSFLILLKINTFFDLEKVIALVSFQRQKVLVFKFKYLEQHCPVC